MDRNFHIRNPAATLPSVALRKESVDRNFLSGWSSKLILIVALRKESVDRNAEIDSARLVNGGGRSPQGERG